MSSLELVRHILLVLIPTVIASIVLTLGRAVLLSYSDKRNDDMLAHARKTLVVAATRSGTDLTPIENIPNRVLVRALVNIAQSVTGPELTRIRNVADQLGVVRRAEQACASFWWWRRLYGARVLTQLGTNNEVVPALVFDRNPVVRAQVAVWVALRQDAGMIKNLIELVYDEVAYCRFAAKDALLRLGAASISPIAERLKLAEGDEARPLLEIAAGIPDGIFLPSAKRLCYDAKPRTRAAAAEVLGAVGGEDAVGELVKLLDDPDSNTRANAARALGRIEHWPSAPKLGNLLADDVWEARSSAAAALRSLGAPGELVLRRVAREGEGVAKDVALQALDLAKSEKA